jgi:hypothetical protein
VLVVFVLVALDAFPSRRSRAHCRNARLTPTLDTSGAIERGCRALDDAIF